MHRWLTTLLPVVFLTALLPSVATAAPPPDDSVVFVEDMDGWGKQITAEILRQNVPLRVTADPESAQYLIRGGFRKVRAEDQLMRVGSTVRGVLEIVDSKDGTVVWAERSGRWSRSASRGLVDKLRKAMRRR